MFLTLSAENMRTKIEDRENFAILPQTNFRLRGNGEHVFHVKLRNFHSPRFFVRIFFQLVRSGTFLDNVWCFSYRFLDTF